MKKPYEIRKVVICSIKNEYCTELMPYSSKIKPNCNKCSLLSCEICGTKLNPNNLCGFHSKPICTYCNGCIECFNEVGMAGGE